LERDLWRARCPETGTPGSGGGSGKPTVGNTSRAPRVDLTDATPLFQAVEAAFHDVAVLVCLAVEAWRAASAAASPGPVAGLIGPFGDRVRDAAPAEPRADRFRAVALVAQDVIGPDAGPTGSDPGHPDRFHHRGETGAVVGVAACDDEAERAASAVAG
ncbi:hypothetical protein CIB93_37035, partial [Streptomyces sp. WZ.A104]